MSNGHDTGRRLAGTIAALMVLGSQAAAPSSALSQVSTNAASGIVGVKHVGIAVRDQDRALAFYTEALGFELAVDEPVGPAVRWIELAIPDSPTRLLLTTGPEVEDRIGTFTNIVLLSEDIAASYESMRSHGVVFEMPPTALPGGGMNAVFRDPDGNTIALATPDQSDEPIPSGIWSGTLRDGSGRSDPLEAEITAAPASVTLIMRGMNLKTRAVHRTGSGLRFIWEPGPLIFCYLDRQANGDLKGDCVDTEEGDSKILTLTPPAPQ